MQLLSVNTGRVRPLQIQGRRIMTAIGKTPVDGPVGVARLGLAGDEQADPSVHGGLSKAVYAWPAEHYPWWQQQRQQAGVSLFDEPLPPGFAGENLTLTGLLEAQVWVGDELHFPDCVLRVAAPREPCFKFNAVMGFAQAGRAMALAGWLQPLRPAVPFAATRYQYFVPGVRPVSSNRAWTESDSKRIRAAPATSWSAGSSRRCICSARAASASQSTPPGRIRLRPNRLPHRCAVVFRKSPRSRPQNADVG